jgi:hypothetical protein
MDSFGINLYKILRIKYFGIKTTLNKKVLNYKVVDLVEY